MGALEPYDGKLSRTAQRARGAIYHSVMKNTKGPNTVSKPTPYAFWIGLPLMLLFVGAGIGGGRWALNRILLERTLYKDGEVTSGVVLQKKMAESRASGGSTQKTVYSVSYRFEVDSRSISNEARVEGKLFRPLKNGDPIAIRYLPTDPNKNLPDGSRLSSLFMFFTVFGFTIGLAALVVTIGMIVDRVRNSPKTNFRARQLH